MADKIRAFQKDFAERYKYLLWPTLILCIIYVLGISSLLRGNINFRDDLGRELTGGIDDWPYFQRYMEYFLACILNLGSTVKDLSPVYEVLASFVTALAGVIIYTTVAEKKEVGIWGYISLIPLGLAPYYMECLSFKFECPYYGFSMLFSVIPLLFYRESEKKYLIATIISVFLMLNTYYAYAGFFPMLVIIVTLKRFLNNEDIKQIVRFVLFSIAGYAIALVAYKVEIGILADDSLQSSMASLSNLIPTIIANVTAYLGYVMLYFKKIWLVLIAIIVVGFIITAAKISKQKLPISIVITLAALMLMACFIFGLYPMLEAPSFTLRAQMGIFAFVAMLCAFIGQDEGINLFKLPILVLSWSFVIFSLEYGNCIYAQTEYNHYMQQVVLEYINDMDYYHETENEVFLQVEGNAGYCPMIEGITTDEAELIKNLTEATFRSDWGWGEIEFYEYYGLKGFNWGTVGDREVNLADIGLPQIDTTMYFDVYGNENNLLIKLK